MLDVNSNEYVLDPVENRKAGRQTHSWVINRAAVGVSAQHMKQWSAVHITTLTAQ